ncbi:MAG: nucleotidyl transferase AbiEii/AbiGii toxin family protein [Spirochaetota bacterium]
MNQINQDFKECLELFNKNDVEYLIVGGYALAYHGAPRFTGDLDIFLSRSKENALRVLKALTDFGFDCIGLTEKDFTEPDKVIELGYPPIRIDLMTSIDGVAWETAWNNREETSYGAVPVYIIGKEDFIANKRASGRKRDLADLEALGVED